MPGPSATCLADEVVLGFVRGSLDAPSVRDVETHLSRCPDCCALIAEASGAVWPELDKAGPDPELLRPGTEVSRYVIEAPLGAGAAGVVYRAQDPELRRAVALKLLKAETGEAGAHHLEEARTMARLAHPNVVNVYDAGSWQGQVFIVMELVDGENLTQWLHAQPRRRQEILDHAIAAGRGLAAAHAAGVIHRDFKPENVLIGADGRARVADFGLARPSHEGPDGTLAGTPGYIAPELFLGHEADARSDQFSFCMTLQNALALPGSDELPRPIGEALLRGLAPDPTARFADMDQLLDTLASAQRNEAAATPTRAPRRTRAGWVALASLGGLAAGAFVVRSGTRRSPEVLSPGTCLSGVAVGYNHACALARDGRVWCWGKVGHEEISAERLGEVSIRHPPFRIHTVKGAPLDNITELAANTTTTCARALNGTAWCWGSGDHGKLGSGWAGGPNRSALASPPADLNFMVQLAPGGYHTCVRREIGTVTCWGLNREGQLGRGQSSAAEAEPQAVEGLPTSVYLASGGHHSCSIAADGVLWCWGDSPGGAPSARPVTVRLSDGTALSQVADLGLGDRHSCAVTKDGGLTCWGDNNFGELGTGNQESSALPSPVRASSGQPITDAASVRAANQFTCVLRKDGSVWCFGNNGFGQLGAGSELKVSSRALPVVTGGGQPLDGVQQIALGGSSACAMKRDGSLWCWGRNQGGQLGTGDVQDRPVATMARPACLP